MASIPAPGRVSIYNELVSVENQIQGILAVWIRGIANNRVQPTSRYSFVSTRTSLRGALPYLSAQAKNINNRYDMLSRLGVPVDDEAHINMPELLNSFLEDRKGTETAGWTLIKALPEIERTIRTVCASVTQVENILDDTIGSFLEAIENLIVNYELDDEIMGYYVLKWNAESLRNELAAAGSEHAIWLDPIRKELEMLEAVVDSECSAAKAISECIANADMCRLSLFRHAVRLGAKIRRQTLLTEYFEPV